MKMFNKLLAVVLSLIMLLSVVPVAVFANENNGSTNTGNGSDVGAGQTTQVTIPVQLGTGSDGTITLTLDAKQLVEALKGDKSMDALKALIKDAVSTTNSDVITFDDVLALVPVSDIVAIILEDMNKETFEAIAGKVLPAISGADLREFASKLDPDAINQDAAIDFFASKLESGDLEEVISAYFVGVTLEQILDAYIDDRDNSAVAAEETPAGFSMRAMAEPAATEESTPTLKQLVQELLGGDITLVQNILKQEESSTIVESFLEKDDNKTLVQDFLSKEKNADVIAEIKSTQPGIVANAGGESISNDELINYIVNNSEALNTVVKENIVATNSDKVVEHIANDPVALDKVVEQVANDDTAKNQVQQQIIKSDDVKKFIFNNYADSINIEKILKDPAVDALDFINLDKLTVADYKKIVKLVGTSKLISLLKDDIFTLVPASTFKTITKRVAFSVLANVDVLAINNYVIGSKPTPESNLTFDIEEIARLVKSLIPSLSEWGNSTDGKILSLNFYAEYTDANDSTKTIKKDFIVEVVVNGDLSTFRAFARKLADYIAVYNDGTDLYIDLTMPAVFTKALAWYIEDCSYGQSIKDEILSLVGKTGSELMEALENLTWDEVVTLLKKVDIEKLYSYVTNLSKVEYILETLQNQLGLNYKLEDLQDLNKLLGEIADGTPRMTFENVCDYISKRINLDVMNYLEKGTAFIDNNETVQALLTKLEKMPYIGSYIAKYNNEVSLNEILDTYKGMEAAEAMALFVEKKFGKDLESFLQNNTANEIYDRLIEEIEERSSTFNYIFERIKDYMLAALDPDYVATSGWGKLVQAIIPDSLLNKLENHSLADAYKGNGKFGFSAESIKIGDNVDTLLNTIFDIINLGDEYVDMIDQIMPTDKLSNVSFGLHVSVTIPGVSRATFHNADGSVDKIMILPNGTLIDSVYALEKDAFWIDQKGNMVSVITEDVDLYPVSGFITGGTLTIDKDGNWTVTSAGENFQIVFQVANPNNDPTLAKMIAGLKAAKSLTLANSKGLTMKMEKDMLGMENNMLGMVLDTAEEYFAVSYKAKTNNSAITNGDYTLTPDRVESFNLATEKGEIKEFNGNTFVITIPFEKALAADGYQKTMVYNVVDGVISTEALDYTVVEDAKVVLDAKHFSDYVVVNEYKFSNKYVDKYNTANEVVAPTAADTMFVAEGATVKIKHNIENKIGKRIDSIKYNDKVLTLGGEFTMPANAVTIVYHVELQAGTIVYNVLGTYYYDLDAANAALDALTANDLPAGYYAVASTDRWIDSTVQNSIVYYAPKLLATQITINFEGITTPVTFSIDNLNINVPALEKGYWTVDGKALDLNAIIAAASKTATDTVNAVVYIEPVADNTVTYKFKGEDKTAIAGAIISFNVTLEAGQILVTAPTGCDLTAMTVDANGNTIYTYTFVAQAGLEITYEVAKDGTAATQLANGVATSATEAETDIKGLKFADWSDALSFANGSYVFALFETEGKTTNLIWLWILLALIVIIGAIVLIYALYKRDKLKPSFLTRFATWAVTLFYNACVAISGLFLMITQGTTKKGEVDYEALGMNAPAETEATEATETAEETVEATETEAVEEITETAEDATETEEAVAADAIETEEVAIDEAIETVEEATETVEEVTETVEEAAETVEEATETVEEVTETVEEATETVEEATETVEEVTETVEEVTETVEEVAVENVTEETVEETAEVVEETTEESEN